MPSNLPPQGKVSISIRMVNEDDKEITVEFTVSDTGIGIPQSRLAHIFLDFEQASREVSKEYGGTGLGLSIVKQLVELQGGSLFVKSKVGEGSTFGFSMSFSKTSETLHEEPAIILKAGNETRKLKVLVAEDIALNQVLIKIILEDFGFECEIAENGKIILEKLKKAEYDITLMDLQMPLMDGFETTDYIRNTMHLQIPIIALTADVTSIDIERSKKVGMDDYISKPIDEELLYNKIINFVDKIG